MPETLPKMIDHLQINGRFIGRLPKPSSFRSVNLYYKMPGALWTVSRIDTGKILEPNEFDNFYAALAYAVEFVEETPEEKA